MDKKPLIHHAPAPHWVGNAFYVRSMFSYGQRHLNPDPFLLLDYAQPRHFPPSQQRRGVGEHPHRGFETITIAYQGEVAHRDSSGGGGIIAAGDVQWMTAGAGIMHDEFFSDAYAQKGGTFEMVQLWLNLPARDKMTPARYQSITASDIPTVSLPNEAGTLRIIAGRFNDHQGPATTYTPVNLWDISQKADSAITLALPANHTVMLLVRHGAVSVNGSAEAGSGQLVSFAPGGTTITIQAKDAAALLLMSGEPIAEPIAGYGPFVMNTEEQIRQALADFNAGQFGHIGQAADRSATGE